MRLFLTTRAAWWAILILMLLPQVALAQQSGRSITDTSFHWPTAQEFWRVLTLQDYNMRIVTIGTALLGMSAGIVGSFMLLRRRALLGDALSHATLPGIALAFIVMASAGASGKNLVGLLAGAVITGLLGVGTILLIRHFTRLKEDAAMGIVLSVFFGSGVALMGIVQQMGTGSQAGLETFIYGKPASMVASDALAIGIICAISALLCAVMFKELRLLCFDQAFAASQGWPVVALDLLLMTLVTTVTVIGLQAVGLILIIALLIIPPAAARFWTERLVAMLIIAAAIGAFSGVLGAAFSALSPRMPAGAIIVVAAAMMFLISMFFGPARGILMRWHHRRQLNRRIERQHLLRAMYEAAERRYGTGEAGRDVSFDELLVARYWSESHATRLVTVGVRAGLAMEKPGRLLCLTELGAAEAKRVVRNHRLWEIYLITHADVAPGQVDRDADRIEHVLGNEMVAELEKALADERAAGVPASPHPIA